MRQSCADFENFCPKGTVLSDALFTYEQYETCLTQIEACLNSHPITMQSPDPGDIGALTPGLFLIGGPITNIPNPDILNVPLNRLKCWELLLKRTQTFWKRWSREYLNTLNQCTKWMKVKDNLKINHIVLLKDENSPPSHWPLAKITAIHPGIDQWCYSKNEN